MKNISKNISDKMWDDFKNLQNNPSTFDNYLNYYNALTDWVRQHLYEIDAVVIHNNRIRSLLNVDAKDYVSKNPDISLNCESQRLFSRRPKTVDLLIMGISNTLWDLVKFRSGKECPKCMGNELSYVIAELTDTKKRRLVLECDTCGWAENADGTEWVDGHYFAYPANRSDIAIR